MKNKNTGTGTQISGNDKNYDFIDPLDSYTIGDEKHAEDPIGLDRRCNLFIAEVIKKVNAKHRDN